MTPSELAWLEYTAAGKSLVIEFGSWCGRSSVALAAAKHLVCIDNWTGSHTGVEGDAAAIQPLERFQQALAAELEAGTVEAVVGELSDADFRDRLLDVFAGRGDVVFVDACHEYEDVARDLQTASRLVADGGVLCGHDYCGAWPGVVRAVHEFAASCARVVKRGPDSIWYLQ